MRTPILDVLLESHVIMVDNNKTRCKTKKTTKRTRLKMIKISDRLRLDSNRKSIGEVSATFKRNTAEQFI